MISFKNLLTIFFSIVTSALVAQQQELVIIGTMHTVSGMTPRAYKPMLKKAIKYQPQAIYVERQPTWDTTSIKNYFPQFYALGDSLAKARTFDLATIEQLLAKATAELSNEELVELRQYYLAGRDYANTEYYGRIIKHGLKGADKPTRNENGDLTYPLGIAMGIKEIRSMDNQTYYNEYFKTWKACDRASQTDGEARHLKKALSKMTLNEVTGILTFKQLGSIYNKPKNADLMHRMNSMEYRQTPCEPCDQANEYWDYRNKMMAQNTATQIIQSGDQRSVIIVGAGHIYGIMEAMARDYPQIKVIRYNDMPDNSKNPLPIKRTKQLAAVNN